MGSPQPLGTDSPMKPRGARFGVMPEGSVHIGYASNRRHLQRWKQALCCFNYFSKCSNRFRVTAGLSSAGVSETRDQGKRRPCLAACFKQISASLKFPMQRLIAVATAALISNVFP